MPVAAELDRGRQVSPAGGKFISPSLPSLVRSMNAEAGESLRVLIRPENIKSPAYERTYFVRNEWTEKGNGTPVSKRNPFTGELWESGREVKIPSAAGRLRLSYDTDELRTLMERISEAFPIPLPKTAEDIEPTVKALHGLTTGDNLYTHFDLETEMLFSGSLEQINQYLPTLTFPHKVLDANGDPLKDADGKEKIAWKNTPYDPLNNCTDAWGTLVTDGKEERVKIHFHSGHNDITTLGVLAAIFHDPIAIAICKRWYGAEFPGMDGEEVGLALMKEGLARKEKSLALEKQREVEGKAEFTHEDQASIVAEVLVAHVFEPDNETIGIEFKKLQDQAFIVAPDITDNKPEDIKETERKLSAALLEATKAFRKQLEAQGITLTNEAVAEAAFALIYPGSKKGDMQKVFADYHSGKEANREMAAAALAIDFARRTETNERRELTEQEQAAQQLAQQVGGRIWAINYQNHTGIHYEGAELCDHVKDQVQQTLRDAHQKVIEIVQPLVSARAIPAPARQQQFLPDGKKNQETVNKYVLEMRTALGDHEADKLKDKADLMQAFRTVAEVTHASVNSQDAKTQEAHKELADKAFVGKISFKELAALLQQNPGLQEFVDNNKAYTEEALVQQLQKLPETDPKKLVVQLAKLHHVPQEVMEKVFAGEPLPSLDKMTNHQAAAVLAAGVVIAAFPEAIVAFPQADELRQRVKELNKMGTFFVSIFPFPGQGHTGAFHFEQGKLCSEHKQESMNKLQEMQSVITSQQLFRPSLTYIKRIDPPGGSQAQNPQKKPESRTSTPSPLPEPSTVSSPQGRAGRPAVPPASEEGRRSSRQADGETKKTRETPKRTVLPLEKLKLIIPDTVRRKLTAAPVVDRAARITKNQLAAYAKITADGTPTSVAPDKPTVAIEHTTSGGGSKPEGVRIVSAAEADRISYVAEKPKPGSKTTHEVREPTPAVMKALEETRAELAHIQAAPKQTPPTETFDAEVTVTSSPTGRKPKTKLRLFSGKDATEALLALTMLAEKRGQLKTQSHHKSHTGMGTNSSGIPSKPSKRPPSRLVESDTGIPRSQAPVNATSSAPKDAPSVLVRPENPTRVLVTAGDGGTDKIPTGVKTTTNPSEATGGQSIKVSKGVSRRAARRRARTERHSASDNSSTGGPDQAPSTLNPHDAVTNRIKKVTGEQTAKRVEQAFAKKDEAEVEQQVAQQMEQAGQATEKEETQVAVGASAPKTASTSGKRQEGTNAGVAAQVKQSDREGEDREKTALRLDGQAETTRIKTATAPSRTGHSEAVETSENENQTATGQTASAQTGTSAPAPTDPGTKEQRGDATASQFAVSTDQNQLGVQDDVTAHQSQTIAASASVAIDPEKVDLADLNAVKYTFLGAFADADDAAFDRELQTLLKNESQPAFSN